MAAAQRPGQRALALRPMGAGKRHLTWVMAQQVAVDPVADDAQVGRQIEVGRQGSARLEVETTVGEIGKDPVDGVDPVDGPAALAQLGAVPAQPTKSLIEPAGQLVVDQPLEAQPPARGAHVGHSRRPAGRITAEEVLDGAHPLAHRGGRVQAAHRVDDAQRRGPPIAHWLGRRCDIAGRGGLAGPGGSGNVHRRSKELIDDTVGHPVDRHDVQAGGATGVKHLHQAHADAHNKASQRRRAVDPARVGVLPAGGDDARPHDGQRHVAAALGQQMLGHTLGQRVGVGVAGAGQQICFGGATGQHLVEQALGRLRQRHQRLPQPVVAVGCDVGGGDADHAGQLAAVAGQGQDVEGGQNIGLAGLQNGQVEVHRGGAVDDVGDLLGEIVARLWVQPTADLVEVARHRGHQPPPVGGQRLEAGRGGQGFEARLDALAALGAHQHIDVVDLDRAAPTVSTQELAEHHFPYKSRCPGQQNTGAG